MYNNLGTKANQELAGESVAHAGDGLGVPELNSCTCPDYQTNLVGTCKHIEGVLLHLKERLGERWDEMAAHSFACKLKREDYDVTVVKIEKVAHKLSK